MEMFILIGNKMDYKNNFYFKMLIKSAKMTNNFYKNKEKLDEVLKAVDNSLEKNHGCPHIYGYQ